MMTRAWLAVGLLWVVACLNYLDRIMITTMRGSLVEAIPMTDAQFGLLTSVFLWVYAALSPFAGFIADRFDRSRVIIGSLMVWSLVTWLTGHAKTFEQLLAARALMGISEAAYIPAAMALIADYHRGPTRSLANGVHLTGIGVGSGLGGLGGWLAERHGWSYAFTLFGIIGIVYSALLVFTLRAAPRDIAEPEPTTRIGEAMTSLLGCGSFYLMLGYWGLFAVAGWALIGWMPTYLTEHFHLSQGTGGLSATGYLQAATLVGLLIGGAWADRWTRSHPRGRVFVAVVGLCIAAPGILLAANTDTLGIAIAGLIVFGLTRAFADANTMPMLCLVADPRYRATGFGLMNLVACTAGGLAIYAGGALRDAHVDLSRIFQFGAGCLALCAVLLWFVKSPRALVCALAVGTAHADVKLPALFSDHMVVQADRVVPVWGWAEPGESVTVSLAKQSQTAQTAADGKWMVKLASLKPQTDPQTMTVTGRNTLTVRDVLVGEVWLCSGQSNMAMLVSGAKDFEQERAAAALPQIRMFSVSGARAEKPERDCAGSWIACTPETVGRFSATAFFFGRQIQRVQGGAVGLITSAVGGTLIESWISPEAQHATPALKDFFAQHEKLMAAFDRAAATEREISTHENITNIGGLFNGKIAPLIPYALRGIVWYQGESNATPERAPFYETQLRLLVRDWRARWGSELPFAWVQLPNVKRTESWAHIREAQLKARDLPRTGMAITIDIGESRNLHPLNKQEVGRRLAQWALGDVYGRKVATSGPLIAAHEIRGGEIVLRFRHIDGGLVAKDGALRGFVIAGENRAWKPAQARIDGDTVIVSAPDVPRPVAVRYAWEADPVCNLTNGAGLPASPFRTDNWKP